MRSATSFFDKTTYRKNLTRFWPIWAANLVLWLMCLPLNALMRLQSDLATENMGSRLESFARNLGDNAAELGLVFALGFSLLAAMAMFSHLYSARSANFMAALPIRREGQFVSHYLAGLTTLLAPNVIVFLLTLLVEAVGGEVWIVPLGYWFLALSGMEFFFYSFAVCLGQFAGHILALPVYYGVFNALVMAVYLLFQLIMDTFYYGFAGFPGIWEAVAYWFTPVLVFSQMDCDVYWTSEDVLVQRVEGLWAVGVYAVVAVILTVCALLLYRRRHMETAGDVVAVKAMHPVFKYGVAVCAGLFFGLVTTYVLGMGEPGLMVAIVLWGIAGYFVAQMLLDKSFRVLHKWKGAAAVTACFLLLFAVIAFDLTGYETRVPDSDDVASVEISGLGGGVYDSGSHLDEVVTDPAIVEKVIAIHQAAVDHRELTEAQMLSHTAEWFSVDLCYTLKNGTVITREYSFSDTPDNAAVPGTLWYAIDQLVSDRSFMWSAYGFDEAKELEQQGAKLINVEYDVEKYTGMKYPEYTEGYPESVNFSGENAEKLLTAVKEDFAAGAIGRDSAVVNSEEMIGRLCFRWEVPAGAALYELSPGQTQSVGPLPYTESESSSFYLEIVVTPEAANTVALLDELSAPVVLGEGEETFEIEIWTPEGE